MTQYSLIYLFAFIVDLPPDDDSKNGANSIKFKAPESASTIEADMYPRKLMSIKAKRHQKRYSLGVCLWTSADYLLDEEEEPALSSEFWYAKKKKEYN